MNIQKQLKKGIIAIVFTSLIISCNEAPKEEVIPKIEDIEVVSDLELYQTKLAENKEFVKAFIEAMRTSNVQKLSTMITDDFSWWIIGKPEYLATAGEHDTEYFLGFFKGSELFPEGTDFKTTAMIAEDNTVAAEAEFRAKTAMGTDYENSYHFLFILEDGKVKRMKEYMDTYHAKMTFGL